MNTHKIDEIFSHFEKYGNNDYIGEQISQVEHAFQCGQLAEQDKYPCDVILSAMLHDIGHLLAYEKETKQTMMIHNNINYGPQNHEKLGADYLRRLGVPESVCYIVENHVLAKRYLVFKDPSYHGKLSEASKQTLVFQGGPLTSEEADKFEKSSTYDVILKMRSWDDLAKDTSLNLASRSNELILRYKKMLAQLCNIAY